MKTFAFLTAAAILAVFSAPPAAEADYVYKYRNGHKYRVYVKPRYHCFVKKVRRYDAYGNVYIKRVRICD